MGAIVIDHKDSLLIKEDPTIKMDEFAPQQTMKFMPPQVLMGDVCVSPPDESDTVAVTIPATAEDTSDVTIHMIKGKVMMVDTISQKIKRKK